MLSVAAAVLVATASATLHDRSFYEQKFYDWLQTHKESVVVQSGEHFVHMLKNFADNHDFIETVNAKNLSYTVGHNQFSHLNRDEWTAFIQKGLNSKPVKATPTSVHKAPLSTDSLPLSVDWRMSGAVTGIKNQGYCGSCWSFSATGAMEGIHMITNGTLVSLSEQMLVDCDSYDDGCNGGLMDNAFAWAQENGGLCTEQAYPYNAVEGNCVMSHCGSRYARPTGHTDVQTNSVGALQSAIAQQPVAVAIEADQQSFQLYVSGVYSNPDCGTTLDHGVLAAGYGTLNGQNYWLIKNSWGTSWGVQGYMYMAMDVAIPEGQCGVLSGPPSYPTM